MRHFHYAGRQPQGTAVEGWIMAQSRDDALQQLRERDISPFRVRPGPGYMPLNVPVNDLLFALRELASMRRSGMPIDEAILAVSETTDHRVLKRSFERVHQMVRSGMSMSEAFGSIPGAFPGYAVPLLRLGEANGKVAAAVTIIADRLDEESRLKSDVKSAMTYPAFLLLTSVSVVLFLFVAIIPRFSSMVAANGEGSGAMSFLLAISGFLINYGWLLGGLALILLIAGVYGWKTGQVQAIGWRVLNRIPGVSDVTESWEVVQFCSCMAKLLPGGVELLDALRLSAEALGREEKRRALMKASELVRQGETLGSALAAHQMFPGLVIQMIRVGEKSANLTGSLEEITELYERRMSEGIKRFLSLLEPAVIVLMGLVVGSIMVSLLSAIVSMNDIPI